MAVLDGKIYVVGGFNGAFLATVEVYDPATNAWSQAAAMGTGRSNLGVAVLGGKLYAAGGRNGTGSMHSSVSLMEVFDPQTNAWTPVAPMSTARGSFAMAAVQGKLYVAGGYAAGGGDGITLAEAYDPQQNHWEAVAPMAQGRHSCAVAAL